MNELIKVNINENQEPVDIPRTSENYKDITTLFAIATVFNQRFKKGMELKSFSHDVKNTEVKNVERDIISIYICNYISNFNRNR